MHPLFEKFVDLLEKADKENCLKLVLESLQQQNIDIVTLYNEVLTPSLTQSVCKDKELSLCIWEEHVRTSIIRTIIENCFLFVLKERDEKYHSPVLGKVIVVCPSDELHEIGPRMVMDFFILCGYQVVFIGANTPQADIITALKQVKPAYVAISITNYYNLVITRIAVQEICQIKRKYGFQVILGGQACAKNPTVCRDIGADFILQSFEEIWNLGGQINASV